MNAGLEPLISIEEIDKSKKEMPIVYFYPNNDEVYSKAFYT